MKTISETITCPVSEIRELLQHVGVRVTLRGWLYGKRAGGKVVFLVVRDGTGLAQCVVEASAVPAFAAATDVTQESSLTLTGMVRAEPRAPGGAEVAVETLEVLQRAEAYPIGRKAHGADFLFSHRHLWLRAPRQTALLRIRHTVTQSVRSFFDRQGFTLIDTPILVPGAGEDRHSLFTVDYFGTPIYLTQTGQLYLESACMALGKVYSFGPTFRAEKSKTRRHLTEFWMVEPEWAFAELEQVMALAEGLVCTVAADVLARHRDDLAALGRDAAALERIVAPFPQLTYSEAVTVLRSSETRARLESDMETRRAQLQARTEELKAAEAESTAARKGWKQDQAETRARELREAVQELEQELRVAPEHLAQAQSFEWGRDLGGSDETILSRCFDRPVFVTEYPREAKAFYMKVKDEDPRVVRNFDLLAPEGYGEIIGGSQREERLPVLLEAMHAKSLRPEDYDWYLDLRRYGSVPHGGFGLGIERILAWLCGLQHVRETIPFPRTMGRVHP